MNVLILGSGGREHAFAWKIAQSNYCGELFIAPGNGGTNTIGKNIHLDPMQFDEVGEFCLKEKIDMVIVGPEAPLVGGIKDYLKNSSKYKHLKVIGPSKTGAQLEGSKAFAKAFMDKYAIPTAGYAEFTRENLAEGLRYIDAQETPIVLKADGLAAGKGVLIIDNKNEAKASLKEMLEGKFGQASSKVVIEDFLSGIEFSVFVLSDGDDYLILPVAKDYKRIGEGDTGLNTGGMGAISPVPFVTEVLLDKVKSRIIQPTIEGLKKENIEYSGFIFLGLIKVGDDPYVIEYNCRMGDPETEVVFCRLESDLLELLDATAKKQLKNQKLNISNQTAVTIMLVSGGYPEAYEKGKRITRIDEVKNSIVFHAGTKKTDKEFITNGGRVIAVSSVAKDMRSALEQSLINAQLIDFEGKYFRKDIGFDL